jgi:hypothetical protein
MSFGELLGGLFGDLVGILLGVIGTLLLLTLPLWALVVLAALVTGPHYWKVWRWTLQLAIKFRLFRRRPARQAQVIVVGHTLTPERGLVVPGRPTRGHSGHRVPATQTLWTGLGLDSDDLDKFLEAVNFHTGEHYQLTQHPGTRRLTLTLAAAMPSEPIVYTPPEPVYATEAGPWLVPFARGRAGPLYWQVDDFADLTDDPTIIDSTHFLNIARTGWGKTYRVLGTLLAHFDRWPNHWTTHVLDRKGTHRGRSIRTLADRVQRLRELVAEIEQAAADHEAGLDYRDQITKRGRVVVVVDEYPELMTKPLPTDPDKTLREEGARLVLRLVTEGRDPGYHVVALGTNARLAAIGPSRDSFDLRYGGWLDNNHWRVLFDEVPPRKLPRRRGLGWVTTNHGLAEALAYEPAPATRRLKAVS